MSDSPSTGFNCTLRTESWTADRVRAAGFDRQQFTLLNPLVYFSAKFGTIIVPAGFETDLASIPRAAWIYLAPDDPVVEYPSVVHDWLYRNGGVLPDGRTFTRAEADEILAEAMDACGARWGQKKVVYAAVRIGGASSWRAK